MEEQANAVIEKLVQDIKNLKGVSEVRFSSHVVHCVDVMIDVITDDEERETEYAVYDLQGEAIMADNNLRIDLLVFDKRRDGCYRLEGEGG